MGDVKRWYPCGNGDSVEMVQFRDDDRFVTSEAPDFVELADYARLERDHAAAQAELTRLRAVEADYAALQGFMRDRMPALIAARLAADDGYDPEDQHGGLYDLRWSGGPEPEPQGDAWSMDYLPRGEKIAADLAEACGRKG